MRAIVTATLAAATIALPTLSPAQPSTLRAGAAKVDVTPAADALPGNYEGVLDRIYARAIVVDDGETTAALISIDAGGVSEALWQNVVGTLESELGIPRDNVLLTATHTHSAPGQAPAPYASKVVEAVRSAKEELVPATAGYGSGVSYINVNRNIIDPATRRWWEGANYDGASDKTVAVVTFATPEGTPIAVYYNYAMHAVVTGQLDLVSGDVPGAASRYIEESLGDGTVALWSSGAAGDQNPLYYQQTYDLREIRVRDYAARGVDISNAMPPGGQGLDKQDPKVAQLMEQQKQMTLSMGQFLGEEVLRAMRGIERASASIRIDGGSKIVTCPGRERTNTGRAGFAGEYREAGPVDIRLGLLRLGDIMIGAVNAEVFNPIAVRLKQESPYARTMLATLTNGSARSGYIPHDAGFGMYTFEVLSSRLQPGCAESAIVNGILDLIAASGH